MLDETGDSRDLNGVSGGSFRSNASSGTGSGGRTGLSASRLDGSGLDGTTSIAYSDDASHRHGKAHGTQSAAASQRGTSIGHSSALSQSNMAGSVVGKSGEDADKSESESGNIPGESETESDEGGGDSAFVSGSILASERSGASKPRVAASPMTSNRAPSATSGRGDGSRLASETNFAFGEAEEDVGSVVSKAASSSAGPAYRSPSLASATGRGSRTGSESSRSMVAGDDDGNTSVTGSVSKASKTRSSPLSHRSGTAGGPPGNSDSNLGFSGFSMPGTKSTAAEDDNGSVTGRSHRTTTGAGSVVSGSRDGTSYDKYEDEPAATAPMPTRRRSSFASSLRQSVASHKTMSPSGSDEEYSRSGSGEGDGEVTGGVSMSQSRFGDDAMSTQSEYSGASSKARSGASGATGKSGHSAAPSSHTVESARSRSTGGTKNDDYDEDKFEEEEVPAEDDEEEQQKAKSEVGSMAATSSAGASESVVTASSVSGRSSRVPAAGASKQTSPGSGRPQSASSRQSNRSTARPPPSAAAASSAAGYSQESFDGPSNSDRHTPAAMSIAPTNDSGDLQHHHHVDDDGAGSSISAAGRNVHSLHHVNMSASGSIFQPPPSGGTTPSSRGGRSGVSIFRRLPADAPDEVDTGSGVASAATGLPPRSPSVRSSMAGGAGGAATDNGDWNEGAIRVAPPGASRLGNVRLGTEHSAGATAAAAAGTRVRPMSAAPRDRQSALLDGLIRKHPATWDTVDVATWVDFLGLGQYRRRFLHHCIDGRLLLRLNDAQLKTELGIGPMGHRAAILDAAANLIKNYKEAQHDRIAAGEIGAEDDDDAVADAAAGSRQDGQRSSTAPRPRPASARRPASASRSVIPPDPFLGPAMGKITVYEQRSKLLFELDRAQARAEQHRALAEQLRYTATLSSEEVAHIRGLLLEIEKKNRAAFDLSGTLDSAARVPWRHVGKGTKLNNWYPERFGRPGDPETVDLTFQPRTNPESRKMLGGGDYGENSGAVNSFLDRLNNDLRKREQTRKELEKRYYGDNANPMSQAELDFNLVSEQLQSRCRITLDRDPAEYEGQIDEAMDKLRAGESWREAGLKEGPIRAAKGPAKIAALATALRSLSFMERYRSDLRSKSGRMQTLERKWINQTLGAQYLPGGKDKEDMEEAAKFFALLGWRDSDGSPSEDAIDTDLLDRLLDRALEYRKRFDAWWERVRDKAEERAAGFKCDVNWFSSPWDTDGLAVLMDAEMKRMGDGGRGAAGGGGSMDFVEFTVGLLGKCREDDLRRLQALNPKPKRLGVYRAIRTQKFIEFTQRDLEERDRKLRQAYDALAPTRRKVEPTRIEGFFERLVEDAARRRAKAEKIEHEKVQKEKEILQSSVMFGRLRAVR
ncbi:hypothetical protein VOLCADRAFT_118480 [Volvox carteri f. nagariensis]|uniref:SAM domain-containing protein n=1 Tax=Volvox carteri f. nagariensis TaxID=3068 RepID=D8U5B0_VOLCA|nr:uncharacterized protein VOLCADRAFT_118480 [Volvox carteri f. nagariensis]EFJ45183.1 hypothetical protein VOLCADRAFT_118480 [Volvox carteri f. nagariensis]|eukprot:XP_002953859.1 hypothetical protein VOLCADRAFT_118480 [Volvox carteri f. nagariensis]